jgi:BirA family biotin operon repressor/biotin-[acetyl-CoA-carboxylase] ligase
VLLSVVVREGLDGARLGLTSLAAAVATSRVCGERYGIKWPNDVVDALGRKVAGILAEAEWEGGRPAFLVLGIGVNVGARPADLPATCLADGGDPRSAEEVALALVPEVLRWAGAAPDEVLAAWRARAATLGSRVRVGEVEGVAVDIAEDGALVVVDEQGVRRLVLAGDVAMVG